MNLRDYELLYDLPDGQYEGSAIGGIRTVTYRAGRSLEVMCHPILKWPEGARREAKRRRTSPQMQRVNERNTMRHIMRLIEANFTPEAIVVTLTYDYPTDDYAMMDRKEAWRVFWEDKLPEDIEDVRRELRNFDGRLKRLVKRRGGDPAAYKWIKRVEEGATEEPYGLPPKFHAHLVIEAPKITVYDIDKLWDRGHVSAERLDMRRDGAARLARYFTKQKRGGRWWSHSRNLKIVQPRVSDRKVSRRRAMELAKDVRQHGREILEALYPGYALQALPEVAYSDYLQGAYIYARMRRRD